MTDVEITRLSAERIMGFKAHGALHWTNGDVSVDRFKWTPLASIADAWMLVEKLKADGWEITIQWHWCEPNLWDWGITLVKREHVRGSHGTEVGRAITIAALRAVGVEI